LHPLACFSYVADYIDLYKPTTVEEF